MIVFKAFRTIPKVIDTSSNISRCVGNAIHGYRHVYYKRRLVTHDRRKKLHPVLISFEDLGFLSNEDFLSKIEVS